MTKKSKKNIKDDYKSSKWLPIFLIALLSIFVVLVNKKLDNGLRCYAECGGLMYLMKSIEGYKMVNFFDGECFMTKSLVNFGYCKVSINEKCFKEKFFLNAHEFHRSIIKSSMKNVYTVQKKDYDGTIKEWKCGYHKKNTLGGYAHISFLSNIKFLESLLFL